MATIPNTLLNDADISAAMLQRLVQLLSASPVYYPWQTIPPDGKAFDAQTVIGTPTVAAGETVVLSLTCKRGYDGIVLRIANNFVGASINIGLPSLIWRIRNGVSINNSKFVDNYSEITTELGTTNFARDISGIFITSGQTLLYTVTNNDAGLPVSPASQVSCCFAGFFWPQQRNMRGQS